MAQYIRKLAKGDFWYYKFDYEGKTYFSKAIYRTKQEAKRSEAEKLIDILQFTAKAGEDYEIGTMEAIKERLKHLRITASSKYYTESKRYLELFHEYFKERVLNNISRHDIHNFIMKMAEYLNNQGKTIHTVNAAIRCYKAFYNFVNEFYETELLNPFKNFKMFPIDKKIKYIPSNEEISALLKICDNEQRRLIEFVMQTGARINEALNLKYGDIQGEYLFLYTRKSRNSNRTPRKLPKPECLKNLNRGKSDDKVFSKWSDRPKFLEKKLKKLKLPLWGWHNLRHRYASKLSKENKPLFEIMSLLGHSILDTTQIYLQLLP